MTYNTAVGKSAHGKRTVGKSRTSCDDGGMARENQEAPEKGTCARDPHPHHVHAPVIPSPPAQPAPHPLMARGPPYTALSRCTADATSPAHPTPSHKPQHIGSQNPQQVCPANPPLGPPAPSHSPPPPHWPLPMGRVKGKGRGG